MYIATPKNPEICKTNTTVLRCSFLWRFPNMGTPTSSIWTDVPWKKHIQLLGYPPWLWNPQIPAGPRWSSRNCRSLSWNQMNSGEVQPNYETLLTHDFILTVTWDLFHLLHPQPKSKTVVWYGLIVLKPKTATHYNIKHPHSMVPHMHKSPNHGFCVVFNIRKGLDYLGWNHFSLDRNDLRIRAFAAISNAVTSTKHCHFLVSSCRCDSDTCEIYGDHMVITHQYLQTWGSTLRTSIRETIAFPVSVAGSPL